MRRMYIFLAYLLLLLSIPCFYVLEARFSYALLDMYMQEHAIPEDISFKSARFGTTNLNPSGDPKFYYACMPSEAIEAESLKVYFRHFNTLEIDDNVIHSGDDIYSIAVENASQIVPMKLYASRGELLYDGYIEFMFSHNVPTMYITTSENALDIVDATSHDAVVKPHIDADVMIVDADGGVDSITDAKLFRHGNTSFDGYNLKSYNMTLPSGTGLLGMHPGRRWVLKSNGQYPTVVMKNQMAFDMAHIMDELSAPEGRYINVYVNGRYLGFFQLSQRIGLPVLPDDDDLAYLVERDVKYRQRANYVMYDGMGVAVHYPEDVTEAELERVRENISRAADAIGQGRAYEELIDVDSFVRMYILQDLFVQTDIDGDSLYFYIGRDGKLYAGPVWDFDCTCGHITTGPYHEELSLNARYFNDYGRMFFKALEGNENFMAEVKKYYNGTLSDMLHKYVEGKLAGDAISIRSSVAMSDIINGISEQNNRNDTNADALRTWMSKRIDFLDEYYANPDDYNLVRFHFAWGNMSAAVRKGYSIGYLPDDAHEGNDDGFWGEVEGFVTQDGAAVTDADIPGDNMELYAVYSEDSYAWEEYSLP